MGTDPALFWSNFFLHHCEAGFVFNLIRTEKTTAVKFNPIQDGFFWGWPGDRGGGGGGGKKVFLPKICHIYPAIMKLKLYLM